MGGQDRGHLPVDGGRWGSQRLLLWGGGESAGELAGCGGRRGLAPAAVLRRGGGARAATKSCRRHFFKALVGI